MLGFVASEFLMYLMFVSGMPIALAILAALTMSYCTPSRAFAPAYPYSPTPIINAVLFEVSCAKVSWANNSVGMSQKNFMMFLFVQKIYPGGKHFTLTIPFVAISLKYEMRSRSVQLPINILSPENRAVPAETSCATVASKSSNFRVT